MINVKDQVYAALLRVHDNVSDLYPSDWQRDFAIQYTEEANDVYTKVDEVESSSYLRFRIDIWSTGNTSEITLKVDKELSALGLVRTGCADTPDPSGRRHKQMRYEGIIDNETQIVYWNGNR